MSKPFHAVIIEFGMNMGGYEKSNENRVQSDPRLSHHQPPRYQNKTRRHHINTAQASKTFTPSTSLIFIRDHRAKTAQPLDLGIYYSTTPTFLKAHS
jgi:hypothetical protein